MKPCYIDVIIPKMFDPENTTEEEYQEVIEIYKNIINTVYYEQ